MANFDTPSAFAACSAAMVKRMPFMTSRSAPGLAVSPTLCIIRNARSGAKAPPGPARLAPQAMGPHELGRLAVNLVTTGLAVRERGFKHLPPSQLFAGTLATAAGTGYALVGLPGHADPGLVAASVYVAYRAWCTRDNPPHTVALQAGARRPQQHDVLAEAVMLAALAEEAVGAGARAGLSPYLLPLAALLAPALWTTARSGSEHAGAARAPAVRALGSVPARIGLGLLGVLAATVAAERLGGASSAVAVSLWLGAQVFPQDS